MELRPPCAFPPGTDPRLHPFLEASSVNGQDVELARLMEAATAWIVRVARHRARWTSDPEMEDAVSEARIQVLNCLQRLRREGDALPPVADFEAYTCALAAKTCAQIQRQRDPERAKVVNRLLYLLTKCTTQQGFAFRAAAGGEHWVGFDGWQSPAPEPPGEARRLQLLTDPRAAAAVIFGAGGWSSLPLPDLVAGLLAWLGEPLKFSELADAVARLQEAPVPLFVLARDAPEEEAAGADAVDPGPSPCDDLRWKEYLAWLWQQTAQLTLPQRSAFLLHSHCLHELEFAGLTSVRQAAGALGLAAERMAELWNALPLDDLAIGALLGVGRQRVINWRKAARIQLGRAWQQWSRE